MEKQELEYLEELYENDDQFVKNSKKPKQESEYRKSAKKKFNNRKQKSKYYEDTWED